MYYYFFLFLSLLNVCIRLTEKSHDAVLSSDTLQAKVLKPIHT